MADESDIRVCDKCGRTIPKKRRCDAVFCRVECREADYAKRSRARRPKPCIADFADLAAALATAPPEVIAYRLGEVVEGQMSLRWWPHTGVRTKRFDGRWSAQPYGLRPTFEPPRLPKVGLYAVELLDAKGQQVPLPMELRRGVRVLIAFPPRPASPKKEVAENSGEGESSPPGSPAAH